MGKRIRDYVKYSLSELERYTRIPGSCVNKVNTPIHLNFPPYGLANFRTTLRHIIAQKKIGSYDRQLKGIVLDLRNIKVLGDVGAMRFDDPAIHLDIHADCYVFQPQIGAIVKGMVKHISDRQIGVIIYRVFSVSIRLTGRIPKHIELNSEIEFRIKRFDLQNVMPFIEGELVEAVDETKAEVKIAVSSDNVVRWQPKTLSKKHQDNASSGYNSDGRIATESPDLFENENVEESDIEPKQKIKREKIPPTPIKKAQSESETIKFESDSSDTQKKDKKHNSSTLETTHLSYIEHDIKQEKLVQSSQKKLKSRKASTSSDSDSSVSKHESTRINSTAIAVNNRSKNFEKKSASIRNENSSQSLDSKERKRKRTISPEPPIIPAKKHKTRTSIPDIVETEIYLDDDIQMIIKPKKKREPIDGSKSTGIDVAESLDSSNLTEKRKKKKSSKS